MAIHFFLNFDIFKWQYLAYYWVNLHQARQNIGPVQKSAGNRATTGKRGKHMIDWKSGLKTETGLDIS